MKKRRDKKSPLYRLWLNLRNRCNNPFTPDYKYYGGRGITVCPTWDNFKQFAADVGPHPGNGLTLDRVDTNKGYMPGNVRWATRKTQSRNRNYCQLDEAAAREIRLAYWGDCANQVTLAARFGVSQKMISNIIRGEAWS